MEHPSLGVGTSPLRGCWGCHQYGKHPPLRNTILLMYSVLEYKDITLPPKQDRYSLCSEKRREKSQIFGLRAMLTQFWRLIARWKALKKTLLPIYGFPIIKLSDHTLIFDWTLICAKYQLVCRVEKVKSGANSLGMSSTVQIIWREGAFLLFFYPPFLFLDPPTPFSIHSISTVGINMIQIHDFFMNSLACAFHSFFRNRGSTWQSSCFCKLVRPVWR